MTVLPDPRTKVMNDLLALLIHVICSRARSRAQKQLFLSRSRSQAWRHESVSDKWMLDTRHWCTMTVKSTRRVLGHSLLRLLVCSHHSLIPLLCTARSVCAVRYAQTFARSLTHSLWSAGEWGSCLWIDRVNSMPFQPIVWLDVSYLPRHSRCLGTRCNS